MCVRDITLFPTGSVMLGTGTCLRARLGLVALQHRLQRRSPLYTPRNTDEESIPVLEKGGGGGRGDGDGHTETIYRKMQPAGTPPVYISEKIDKNGVAGGVSRPASSTLSSADRIVPEASEAADSQPRASSSAADGTAPSPSDARAPEEVVTRDGFRIQRIDKFSVNIVGRVTLDQNASTSTTDSTTNLNTGSDGDRGSVENQSVRRRVSGMGRPKHKSMFEELRVTDRWEKLKTFGTAWDWKYLDGEVEEGRILRGEFALVN